MDEAKPKIKFDPHSLLQVTVKNPDGVVFDGKAEAVSSFNKKGKFDILPYHANLISIIQDNLTIWETKEKPKEIKIENGVLEVSENVVKVFLGIEPVS